MTVQISNNQFSDYEIGEARFSPKSYRCHLAITKDEDNRFSAIVLNLPGVGSCGDTELEATANVKEAVSAIIGAYLKDDAEIPWATKYDIPEEAKQKWILVDA